MWIVWWFKNFEISDAEESQIFKFYSASWRGLSKIVAMTLVKKIFCLKLELCEFSLINLEILNSIDLESINNWHTKKNLEEVVEAIFVI